MKTLLNKSLLFTFIFLVLSEANLVLAEMSKLSMVQIQDQILVVDGDLFYSIDIEGIKKDLKWNPKLTIRIYSTNIWLELDKTGTPNLISGRSKTRDYIVLAPMKSLDAFGAERENYKIGGRGNSRTDSVFYPDKFCTECARSTKIDENLKKLVSLLMEVHSVLSSDLSNSTSASNKLAKFLLNSEVCSSRTMTQIALSVLDEVKQKMGDDDYQKSSSSRAESTLKHRCSNIVATN